MRKKKNQDKHHPTENKLNNSENELNLQSTEQTLLRTKNVVEFAKFSYELEEKREQSLLSQSGHLLTLFSVSSAILFTTVPVLLSYTNFDTGRILLFSGISLSILLVSMLLAVISQWRFGYETMMNGEELLQKIKENINSYAYQSHYDYQWIDQLKLIQDSKKKNNDKRYKLINASMILFFIAILSIVVFASILVLLWK